MSLIRRTGIVLRGLFAAAVLLVLVAGVPAALVATVGNPVPEGWTWGAPITNMALLGILACVAWVLWVQLMICVIVETVAELRFAAGHSADWLARAHSGPGGRRYRRDDDCRIRHRDSLDLTRRRGDIESGIGVRSRLGRCPNRRCADAAGAGQAQMAADDRSRSRSRRHPLVDRGASPWCG